MKTPINKTHVKKVTKVAADSEFRGHLKDSVVSATKAGSRARKVNRADKKRCCSKKAKLVAPVLIAGVAALVLVKLSTKE